MCGALFSLAPFRHVDTIPAGQVLPIWWYKVARRHANQQYGTRNSTLNRVIELFNSHKLYLLNLSLHIR